MKSVIVKNKTHVGILAFLFWTLTLSLTAQETVTVYPDQYTNALRNPLKGFRLNLNDAGNQEYKYTTIVRDYIRWNEIENDASDGVQKLIDYANDNWSHLPALNVKVIPRIYLDWDSNSGNEYWPADLTNGDWSSQEFKDRVVNMVAKMGEAWDNDPRVAWVQTGIIGYWGEQENPVGIDEDGWATRLGTAFDAAFQNKKLLVRNQRRWDPYGFKYGVYWDSYGHPGQTNGSWADIRNTNAQGRYLTEVIEGEVAYNWGESSFDPLYGGEPEITLDDYIYANNMIDVIKELHCTGLGWISSYFSINSGLNVNRDSIAANADRMQKTFGYRYIIPEFTSPLRAEQGGQLDLNFKVINQGSAPVYLNWPVAFTLIDETSKQTIWTEIIPDVDITQWLPGDHYNYATRKYDTPAPEYLVNASFTVPENLPTGQYMAGISILDPSTMLPGIFFAIENFVAESQSQPISRMAIGEDLIGDPEVDPAIFADPLDDDARFYSMENTLNAKITYPADGASFSPPAEFPVYVTAFKNGGSVDSVELYIDGIHQDTRYASPYIFFVSSPDPGILTVEIRAYDDEGAVLNDQTTVNIQIPGGLPWSEQFELPNGTKTDAGETAWTSNRSGGIFEVNNNAFKVSDGKTFIGEFITEEIDIAAAPVTVSLDVTANDGGLDTGEDYIKLFRKIDEGSEVLIDMVDGAQSKTLTESNITGNFLQLIVRGYTTYSGEVYLFDNLTVSYDVEPPTKNITVEVNGNGVVDPPAGLHTYYEGQTVSLTASPGYGYTFDGWSGDLSSSINPGEVIMDADKTITANFIELPKYSLTISALNGSISNSEEGVDFYEGSTITLTAIPDSAYKFDSWSGDASGTEDKLIVIMDGDKSITANFIEIPDYTLTISAENGSVALDPDSDTYLEGTEITLLASPDEGYEFDSWSGDLTGEENPMTLTMDGDKNIAANFLAIPVYTLNITASNGTVTMNPDGGSYLEGTEITLTAVSDQGFEFEAWSGNMSGSANPVTIEMDADKNITAIFVAIPEYTLTISAINGLVLLDPEGGAFPEGTVVTLTAIPDNGYEFSSWTGDLSATTNPLSLTMEEDKNITANFDVIIGIRGLSVPVYNGLGQNYPNPFNESTLIPYNLSTGSQVKLAIYTILGEQVLVLVNEHRDAGYYVEEFNVSDLERGLTPGTVYLYQLMTDREIYVRKLIFGH